MSAEPGAGKTALIQSVHETLTDDAVVLRSGPLPVERDISWSTLGMLSTDWASADLSPLVAAAIGRSEPQVNLSAADVAYGWVDHLRSRAAVRPSVIVLDDLQWIDEASAAALAVAARTVPCFWLISQRSMTESHLDLTRLADQLDVTDVALGRLRRSEVGELLFDRFGGRWTPSEITHVFETSEGHPLHAIELGRELRQLPGVVATDRTLAAIYGDRWEALDDAARDLAGLIALAVRPTLELLDELRPGDDGDASLDALERAGLIQVGDTSVQYTHALARHAVQLRLGSVERARLHRDLATVVEDAEQRAWHLGQGFRRADEAIAEALERAASVATGRGATADAARILDQAIRLTPSRMAASLDRRRVLLAIALCDSGDFVRSDQLFQRLLTCEVHEGLIEEMYATAAVSAHRTRGSAAAEEVVLMAIDRQTDSAARGRCWRTLMRIRQFDDVRGAEQTALEAFEDARRLGGADEMLGAEAALANVRFVRGEPVDLDGLIARLDPGTASAASQSAITFIQELAIWDDRFDVARRLTALAVEHGRDTGAVGSLSNALSQGASTELRAGDLSTCRKLIDEVMELLTPRRGAELFLAVEELIPLSATEGDHEQAERIIRDAEAEIEQIPLVMRIAFASLAGYARLVAGDLVDARRLLELAWAFADQYGMRDCRILGFQADLAEVAVLTGDLARADEVVRVLGKAADRCRSTVVQVDYLRCRGQLELARGDNSAALASLEAAAVLAPATLRPLVVGRTLLALGAAARHHGERRRAREVLQLARMEFDRLGAVPFVQRVDAEMVRLGVRQSAPGELTETEHRIADLAAQGRSNREIATELIVSLRTVESNLTRIYRKVGVRSRTELAAAWSTSSRRRPTADGPT